MIEIPHSRPAFGQAFEDAALKVIQSGFVTQGQETKALEQDISLKLRQRHVLAVDSGTSALMLAIRYLTGNKVGAKVGIPAFACASLLFAVKAAQATPVFMDNETSLCLNKTQAMKTAKDLDVLILVHPFGLVEPLVTEHFPCPVIEDIAQSVGATIHGQSVGTFTEMSIGSLYATKTWGGAYGGFITSNNEATIQHIRAMSDPDQALLDTRYAGHHQLSDLHATLARTRLQIAPHEQKARKRLSEKYDTLISKTTATKIESLNDSESNHFRYLIRTEQSAESIISQFRALGIGASKPVQRPLHHASQSQTACPNANDAWEHCISLPLLTKLSDLEFAHMKLGIENCLDS